MHKNRKDNFKHINDQTNKYHQYNQTIPEKQHNGLLHTSGSLLTAAAKFASDKPEKWAKRRQKTPLRWDHTWMYLFLIFLYDFTFCLFFLLQGRISLASCWSVDQGVISRRRPHLSPLHLCPPPPPPFLGRFLSVRDGAHTECAPTK